MNVKELIEKLQDLPQDAMVVIPAYAAGVDEAELITEELIVLDAHEDDPWQYGQHELVFDTHKAKKDSSVVRAVMIC